MRATDRDLEILAEHSPDWFPECCGNEGWRGHLCSMHDGWIEGWYACEAALRGAGRL